MFLSQAPLLLVHGFCVSHFAASADSVATEVQKLLEVITFAVSDSTVHDRMSSTYKSPIM